MPGFFWNITTRVSLTRQRGCGCPLVRGRVQITFWLFAVIAVVIAFPARSGLPSLQHRFFIVVWGYQGAARIAHIPYRLPGR